MIKFVKCCYWFGARSWSFKIVNRKIWMRRYCLFLNGCSFLQSIISTVLSQAWIYSDSSSTAPTSPLYLCLKFILIFPSLFRVYTASFLCLLGDSDDLPAPLSFALQMLLNKCSANVLLCWPVLPDLELVSYFHTWLGWWYCRGSEGGVFDDNILSV